MAAQTNFKDLIAQHDQTAKKVSELHFEIALRALEQSSELVETLNWLAAKGNTNGVAQAAGNMASKVKAENENLASLISKAFA